MESVKEQFVATIRQWFPNADLETDPQTVDALKVRLTERVYVPELDKQRRTNPIIIHVSEHVHSDLSHLTGEQLKRAFQAIKGYVDHRLGEYDSGLLRDAYSTTQPFHIDIPTSIY
jgi:hypothetical protein